jgi:fatty-acyl-CoA synthase
VGGTAGDMARMDAEGYYYLVDRKKNMIITGGENVYPSEIEEVISTHPAVKELAVIGIPDEKWGELVVAIIVPEQGSQPDEALAKQIIDFTKGKMAGFKRPRKIYFITAEEMPRTGTGKILHRVLKERFG